MFKVKSEIRERKRHKKRYAPTGSGFADQAKRTKLNKGYAGVKKSSIKVNIK